MEESEKAHHLLSYVQLADGEKRCFFSTVGNKEQTFSPVLESMYVTFAPETAMVLGTAGPGPKTSAGPLFFMISFYLGLGPLLATISAGPGAMPPLDHT